MCGIAGIVCPHRDERVAEDRLLRMAAALRHRGPDGFGIALDPGAGFAATRLAIVDLHAGWQPLNTAPDGSLLVYNGEVYNHAELRSGLESRGVRFTTATDTEVVLRLLEREGLAALHRLNGQWALGWWDPRARRLVLVRDRFGVRPLHYALLADGTLVFGSEAKALFASGLVAATPDLVGIDEVFTLWGPRPPRTAFRGVAQLPPGALLVWEDGRIVDERRWWTPAPWEARDDGADLEELLRDSVRLRLGADVPVGAYLSGGLDSSLLCALAQSERGGGLRSFSVGFGDADYDERSHQERVVRDLETEHHLLEVGLADIAEVFPEVVRHAEAPLVRTAPAPLYLLAREVRRQGVTVVLTGEGADELFWGYDLFKEVAVRRLHAQDPARAELLLDSLYPYLGSAGRRGPGWRQALLAAGRPGDPIGSHLTRAVATSTVKAFYAADVEAELVSQDPLGRLREELPAGFSGLGELERASWLEVTTLLEPYLLAAQGDRMSLAHGVEARHPFLDHRVHAYAVHLAAAGKLEGARDKVVLRDLARRLLPTVIAERPKQPYRSPAVAPFFAPGAPEWVAGALDVTAAGASGLWNGDRVARLVGRCRAGRVAGARESMALVGILSSELWHRALCAAHPDSYLPETARPRVRIDRTARAAVGAAA